VPNARDSDAAAGIFILVTVPSSTAELPIYGTSAALVIDKLNLF